MNLEAGDPPDFVREGDSLALYRQLVRAVTDYAIYAIDPDGYVVNWNPGAERIKGYTRDEIVGEHFSRFYTEEDVASGRPERLLRIGEQVALHVLAPEHVQDGLRRDPLVDVERDGVDDELLRLPLTGPFEPRLPATEQLTKQRAVLFG